MDNNVLTYDEIIHLAGLPLVNADDMPGFEGYQVALTNGNVDIVSYVFDEYNVFVCCNETNIPENLPSITYDDKVFHYEKTVISENINQITAYYASSNGILFIGKSTGKTITESIKWLNALIFE